MVTVLWIPDTCASSCQQCNAKFTFMVRKHHCRVCGEVICNKCVRSSRVIADWGQDSKVVKVCVGCKGATWMPDSEATRCVSCEKTFTLRNRKHHCRRCGRIFCSPCSSYYKELPTSIAGVFRSERVCQSCFEHDNGGRPRSRTCGATQHRKSIFQKVFPSFALRARQNGENEEDDEIEPADDLSLGSQHNTPRQIELDDIEDEEDITNISSNKNLLSPDTSQQPPQPQPQPQPQNLSPNEGTAANTSTDVMARNTSFFSGSLDDLCDELIIGASSIPEKPAVDSIEIDDEKG